MYQKFRYRIAVFFAILFITIVSAPTIILSIDDSVDATIFLGENDEEEKENVIRLEKEKENQKLAEEKNTDADANAKLIKNNFIYFSLTSWFGNSRNFITIKNIKE